MELKNAGFENADESRNSARHQMLDGDEFSVNGYTLWFNGNTFVCKSAREEEELIGAFWYSMSEWQVEVDWKESLSPESPRWCWVGNAESCRKISQVDKFEDGGYHPYRLDPFSAWEYAEPVSDELAAMLDAELVK